MTSPLWVSQSEFFGYIYKRDGGYIPHKDSVGTRRSCHSGRNRLGKERNRGESQDPGGRHYVTTWSLGRIHSSHSCPCLGSKLNERETGEVGKKNRENPTGPIWVTRSHMQGKGQVTVLYGHMQWVSGGLLQKETECCSQEKEKGN